jgi:hypothetical protein
LAHDAACFTGAVMRSASLVICLLLSGCYVKVNGVQSASGGATASAASSQISGSAKFSGGRAYFSSGRTVSPQAGGGHLSLGKGPTAVLVIGLMIADAMDYFGSGFTASRTAPGEAISETCSCYRKPLMSDE